MKKFNKLLISSIGLPIVTLPVITSCSAQTTYKVSYVLNAPGSIDDQIVISGQKAVQPQNPTKTGYSFVCWCSDMQQSKEYDFSQPVTSNLVLYAKWQKQSEFDGKVSQEQWVSAFEKAADFNSWNYRVEGQGAIVRDGVATKTSTTEIDVYAQQFKSTYTSGDEEEIVYGKRQNNSYYTLQKDDSAKWTATSIGCNLLINETIPHGYWLEAQDLYKYFKFDESIKGYKYSQLYSEECLDYCSIGFNSNYQIEWLTQVFITDENNYDYYYYELSKFNDVDPISFPKDEIEYPVTELTWNETGKYYESPKETVPAHLIKVKAVDDFDVAIFNVLKSETELFEGTDALDQIEVYLNNAKAGCKITQFMQESRASIHSYEFKKDDVIYISYSSSYWFDESIPFIKLNPTIE